MISFRKFLLESEVKRKHDAKVGRYGNASALYEYPEKEIGGYTVRVHSRAYYNAVRGTKDKVKIHHTFTWDVGKKGDMWSTNYDRGRNRDLKKHGLAVWAHVHRAVREIINTARKHNEIDSADFAGNSRSKQKFYRKAAERIGRETGAKRVEHDSDTSYLHYDRH